VPSLTLMTAMTMNCRGSLKAVPHALRNWEVVRGTQEHRAQKCDKVRCKSLRFGAEARPLTQDRLSTRAITCDDKLACNARGSFGELSELKSALDVLVVLICAVLLSTRPRRGATT
jgi:hypothetical protein